MIDLSEILNKYGTQGVELLKESVRPYNATGETERSISYDVSQNEKSSNLTFYGRKFFPSVETGRKERESEKYSGFDLALTKWLNARNFEQRKSKTGTIYYKVGESWMTAKSLAYKINKEGDRTFNEGGREVYTQKFNKFIDEMVTSIKNETTDTIIKVVRLEF